MYEDRPKIAGAWRPKIACFNSINSEITGRKFTKFGKKVQIHHPYIKSFHTVKRLRKLVQYIRKYLTKCQFFGRVVPDVHK